MKFDREIIVGIIICGVILIGWDPFARKMGWLPPRDTPAATETAKPAEAKDSPAAEPEKTVAPVAPAPVEAARTATAPAPAKPVELPAAGPRVADVFLDNDDLHVTIDPNSGAVTAIQLKKYKKAVPLDKPKGSFSLAHHRGTEHADPVVFKTADGALDLRIVGKDSPWRPVGVQVSAPSDRKVTVRRRIVNAATGAELTVTQTWSLGDSGYTIKYEVAVANSGKTALVLPVMQVGGGVLGASQQLSGDAVRGDAHYLDFMTAAGDYSEIAADKKDEKFQAVDQTPVLWTALSNKYFCMILKSGRDKESFKLVAGRSGEVKNADSIRLETGMALPVKQLQPDETEQYSFDYYCGPKILGNLNAFADSTAKVMHLSWGPLNYLARFMLWFLVKLHSLIGSYGVSIIILTLLVRLIFYPLTARGNESMKKMQAVQPKLKELREKYKDNPQLMNTKMMELYRAEGINPFGGCLPVLLQIPVFFALYSTFNNAVELRQSSFLWCHNLAAADTVAYVFSLPINPLVLVMTALMVLQQAITPMSMEPAQKKMMLAMPIVMLFFFYDLPSGLTLYWTVSNVFSIIQLRLQQRGRKTTAAADAAKN